MAWFQDIPCLLEEDELTACLRAKGWPPKKEV